MSETWISWAIRAPVPPGYTGYSFDPDRGLDEILYIVNHSGEGYASYLVKGYRPGEPASWTFSNLYDGTLYQHAPLEALTYTSGSYEANRDGIGREHEGVTGEPLTAAQVATDRKLDAELAKLCPNLRPLVKGQGYREHSELTGGATSCPSGRIQPLYDSYESEEHMGLTVDQENMLKTIFQKANENEAQIVKILAKLDAITAGDGKHRHE